MAVIAISFFIITVSPLRFAVCPSPFLAGGNINMCGSTLSCQSFVENIAFWAIPHDHRRVAKEDGYDLR